LKTEKKKVKNGRRADEKKGGRRPEFAAWGGTKHTERGEAVQAGERDKQQKNNREHGTKNLKRERRKNGNKEGNRTTGPPSMVYSKNYARNCDLSRKRESGKENLERESAQEGNIN